MLKLHTTANLDNLRKLMGVLNLSKNYETPIKAFLRYCKENGLKPDALAFRQAAEAKYEAVKNGELSGSTYNLFISACRTFVLRSMELGNRPSLDFLAAQRMTKVKRVTVNSRIETDGVLTKKEISLLQEYASPRTRLLIQVLKNTGLRISEALRLPAIMELNKDYAQAKILGKGGKIRMVYLPMPLFRAIQAQFKGKRFLLETKNGRTIHRAEAFKMIRAAGKAAIKAGKADCSLLRKAHPHSLRHAFATEALKKTKDIDLVSRMLSHSSIAITSRCYISREIQADDYLKVYAS